MQNRCIRAILNLPPWHSRKDLYDKANTLPILAMHNLQTNLFLYKILHNRTNSSYNFHSADHNINTRHSNNLTRIRIKSQSGKKCFSYCGPTIFNLLPYNIKQETRFEILKKKLHAHLMAHLTQFII